MSSVSLVNNSTEHKVSSGTTLFEHTIIFSSAKKFHDEWRKEQTAIYHFEGTATARTANCAWIKNNGTKEVDLINTEYGDLPPDIQHLYISQAVSVSNVIDQHFYSETTILNDEDIFNHVGMLVFNSFQKSEYLKDKEGRRYSDLPYQERAQYVKAYLTLLSSV